MFSHSIINPKSQKRKEEKIGNQRLKNKNKKPH